MIRHIKTVAVYVTDQKRSLEFYTNKLGFEVRRNEHMGPNASWIELAPPGAQTCLAIYPRAMMKNWQELKPSVVFNCDDAHVTCEALAVQGVQITDQPKKMVWGTYAKFADPDGNEFLVVSQ